MNTAVKKFLSKKYDQYYERAAKLIAKENPCKFENGKCFSGAENGCCRNCRQPGKENGCPVKNLSCKFYLCDKVRREYPELAKKIDKIRSKAVRVGLFPGSFYFMSKEQYFSQIELGRRDFFNQHFLKFYLLTWKVRFLKTIALNVNTLANYFFKKLDRIESKTNMKFY